MAKSLSKDFLVVYKNQYDKTEEWPDGKYHWGRVLTSVERIEKGALYIDVDTFGDLVDCEPDYKNLHINSVDIKNVVCFTDSEAAIKSNFSSHWI